MELSTVRWVYPNRFSTPAKIKKKFKLDDFRYAALHVTITRKQIHASWSNNSDTYAVPFYVYDQIIQDEQDSVIYVEQRDAKSAIYIRIDNGVLMEDYLGSFSSVIDKLYGIAEMSARSSKPHRVLFYEVDDKSILHTKSLFEVESYPDGLVKNASEEDIKQYQYRPLNEAIKKTRSIKRINPIIAWSVLLFISASLFFLGGGDEVEVTPIQIIDRYAGYKTAITTSEVDVTNRLREDYNNHLSLTGLPAWDVVAVQHTQDYISYTVEAKSNGVVSLLNEWALNHGFRVLRVDNEVTLVRPPSNVPVYDMQASEVPIHNLDQVTDLLADAVTLYIARSNLSIQREHTQARENWRRRDVNIGFTNAYKEDLLTLAAIIESTQLPVSVRESNYRINDERLTGNLILSIFGD